MENCEMGSLIFYFFFSQGKLEDTKIKKKISRHIRQDKMLSHPKLTNRALLDPGGENECTWIYKRLST